MCVCTFALWWVLTAVSQDVNLIDSPVWFEKLLQLLLRPGARDLSHKHLNCVWIRLIRMLQSSVHLSSCAVTGQREKERDRGGDYQSLNALITCHDDDVY